MNYKYFKPFLMPIWWPFCVKNLAVHNVGTMFPQFLWKVSFSILIAESKSIFRIHKFPLYVEF